LESDCSSASGQLSARRSWIQSTPSGTN
ncbi:uncharacterized protein METZ01_LOCUS335857, partial [marine metagenome]